MIGGWRICCSSRRVHMQVDTLSVVWRELGDSLPGAVGRETAGRWVSCGAGNRLLCKCFASCDSTPLALLI